MKSQGLLGGEVKSEISLALNIMKTNNIPRPDNDFVCDYLFDFKLKKEKTALVVVDMQYASACRHTGAGRIMKERGTKQLGTYRFDRLEQIVIPNINKILSYCREKQIRIVYLTYGSEMHDFSDLMPHKLMARAMNNTRGTREHEILDELKPLKGDCVINKTTTGAFNSSCIDAVLRSMQIEYMLFTGVSTNSCVDLTARDASDRGYKCVLIEDCLGASKEEHHNYALLNFQRLAGRVESLEDIIKELEQA